MELQTNTDEKMSLFKCDPVTVELMQKLRFHNRKLNTSVILTIFRLFHKLSTCPILESTLVAGRPFQLAKNTSSANHRWLSNQRSYMTNSGFEKMLNNVIYYILNGHRLFNIDQI